MLANLHQADTDPDDVAGALVPKDLRERGWRVHLKDREFWAKNKQLNLSSSGCESVAAAVKEARELESHVIRCPECGTADNLEPHFEGQNIVAFSCPDGHRFDNDTRKAGGAKAATEKSRDLGSSQLTIIPRKKLDESPTNARQIFDEIKLAELAESIASKGIIEPLIVRATKSGRFEIVAGERRFRASDIAGLDSLPCIVRQLSDREAEELQTIENDQREDLNPIERGAGYLKLIERHGHTPETLAATVGKSKTFIYDQIKLAKLPDVARKAMIDGQLTLSTATLIARIPSESRRESAAREILPDKKQWREETLSFRQAKSLIERKYTTQLKGAPFSREDATLVPAAGACTTCPKLVGNNPTEFPDGRADVCTDPQCFNQKVAAYDARTRAKAKESEIKVLPASTCKGLFNSWDNHLRHDAAYIDLADQCSQDKQKKKRSYKQLLGDAAEPVLAINPRNHRAHYLVPAKEAAKILEKTHSIKIQIAGTSRSSLPRKNPEAEAKRKLDSQIFERAVQLAGEEIALQAEVTLARTMFGPGEPVLKEIALLFLESAFQFGHDRETLDRIATRRQVFTATKKSRFGASEDALTKSAKNMPPEAVFGLILELELQTDVFGSLDERQKKILHIFPRVGDFKNYLDRAREELTAAAPPAPLKAKAAGRSK